MKTDVTKKRDFFTRGVLCVAILAGVVVLQNPAQAEMMRGTVVAVKNDGQSVVFKRSDPSNPSVTESFNVAMVPYTRFENIGSLKELAAGDEVAMDVVRDEEDKAWEANSVRIFKMRIYQTDAAQEMQPD